jgi:hypothetical protein
VCGVILEEVGGVDHTKVDPLNGDHTSPGHSIVAAIHFFAMCVHKYLHLLAHSGSY